MRATGRPGRLPADPSFNVRGDAPPPVTSIDASSRRRSVRSGPRQGRAPPSLRRPPPRPARRRHRFARSRPALLDAGQIDGAQRLHQRRDRLHVTGHAKVLAIGDAAFEPAGTIGRPGDAASAIVAVARARSRRGPASPARGATSTPSPIATALMAESTSSPGRAGHRACGPTGRSCRDRPARRGPPPRTRRRPYRLPRARRRSPAIIAARRRDRRSAAAHPAAIARTCSNGHERIAEGETRTRC